MEALVLDNQRPREAALYWQPLGAHGTKLIWPATAPAANQTVGVMP